MKAWCNECKQWTTVDVADHGIGNYDFGSMRCKDTLEVVETDCCLGIGWTDEEKSVLITVEMVKAYWEEMYCG